MPMGTAIRAIHYAASPWSAPWVIALHRVICDDSGCSVHQ